MRATHLIQAEQDLSQGQNSSPDSAHHIKIFNVKLFANAHAATDGSSIALPGRRPGELKMCL